MHLDHGKATSDLPRMTIPVPPTSKNIFLIQRNPVLKIKTEEQGYIWHALFKKKSLGLPSWEQRLSSSACLLKKEPGKEWIPVIRITGMETAGSGVQSYAPLQQSPSAWATGVCLRDKQELRHTPWSFFLPLCLPLFMFFNHQIFKIFQNMLCKSLNMKNN